MYSYKINNSYTVYINYTYLNDCIKAGKKFGTRKKLQRQELMDRKEVYLPNTIKVGSAVTLLDMDSGERRTITILPTKEFIPSMNTASENSPVGKALVGHRVGDRVSIGIPSGLVRYKVLNF